MIKFGNKVVTYNNKWAKYDDVPPLQPFTIRLKYKQGTTPTFSKGTGLLVDATNNIWDLTYENSNWNELLASHYDLIEVLEANTEHVTYMGSMLYNCIALTSVPLFDTSNVIDMYRMFYYCRSLTSIPLFNTSKVSSMNWMFNACVNVESGALALYKQASTQSNIPSHSLTFYNCGRDTTTGAAELAQIPSGWK